jgi:hypothetical protein
MNSPALSETIGAGLNVKTERIGEESWKASVPSQPTIPAATALTEQTAIQMLTQNIGKWLAGNRG